MDPSEFAAHMWGGAVEMVEQKRDELGEVINMSVGVLITVIAFAHDCDEQAKYSKADIFEEIKTVQTC